MTCDDLGRPRTACGQPRTNWDHTGNRWGSPGGAFGEILGHVWEAAEHLGETPAAGVAPKCSIYTPVQCQKMKERLLTLQDAMTKTRKAVDKLTTAQQGQYWAEGSAQLLKESFGAAAASLSSMTGGGWFTWDTWMTKNVVSISLVVYYY